MKKLRKNNKGFSLVELIVVVLIMAIIAVALAPQVMKWVNNSREATDASVYDTLVEDLQLALANSKAHDYVKTNAGSTGAVVYLGSDGLAGDILAGNLDTQMKSVTGDDNYKDNMKAPNGAKKSQTTDSKCYSVTITNDGAVQRTNAPKPDMNE
jgi:prepilin-type N-terminal cleavage/methylation domain-containing protein